ncbi:hypothetical protein GIB67_001616 [Kingdonia uniflora]|uniref:Uncharacterized protein n=1 Tax=Kingdonia uniflora TaxID=39325 RepID=A0A7J7L0U8_9MAGN|nr:hypothetical protein GIB67_001616 [Kingdonia uniflora]
MRNTITTMKPFWMEKTKDSSTVIQDLISSLNNKREVTLALRTGLIDARADFSFLRVRGLRNILKFLRSIADSDSAICVFWSTQSAPQLQVVPVLFRYSLNRSVTENLVPNLDHVFSVKPMKITSPSTDTEVALALRVLEGCCLLHRDSAGFAHRHNATKVLMDILSSGGVLVRGPCLDALVAIMLDSSSNQKDFEACHGIEKITELIKDNQVEENIRLRCGEFLLILIGHLNGKEKTPMAKIHEDIRLLLGERSASLIWAASQFGSTLDPEQRQMALQIQARRVLESLEL